MCPPVIGIIARIECSTLEKDKDILYGMHFCVIYYLP